MTETEEVAMMMKWGTWEELLLGGAVLRHGIQAWDAVAAEIRSRTPYPFSFTAEVCKAKYEDVQERYCGCNAWFEEIRKRRVAELKHELEKSNDSIGTLETKLQSLKGEHKGEEENYYHLKYDSNRTESPIFNGSSDRVGFSGMEASNSKDGLSAGSFTEENRALWSPEAQITANVPTQETEIKQEEDVEKATPTTTTSVDTFGGGRIGGSLTKRRGKRKRKDCSREMTVRMAKEGSFGESDVLSSVDARGGDNDRILRPAVDGDHRDDPTATVKQEESSDLMEILSSFMEKGNENASVFRNRLDSQKKARYKRTIRCHVDFSTIRLRVADGLITSDKELFRDLLLLATNALVFYPQTSPEYVSAVSLRDLAIKTFRQDRGVPIRDTSCSGGGSDLVVVMAVEAPVLNPRVKPRSIRPRNRKVSATAVAEEAPKGESKNVAEEVPKGESKNSCDVEVPPGFAQLEQVKKSGVKRVKVGRRNGTKRQQETATAPIVVEETPKGVSKKSSVVRRGNVTKRQHETAAVLPIVEETPKEESKKPSVDIELPLLDPSSPMEEPVKKVRARSGKGTKRRHETATVLPIVDETPTGESKQPVEEAVKKVRVRPGNVGRGSRVKQESVTPVKEKKRARRR